ncbi:MAG: hypothetical protein GY716_22855 [bacterium]|nr:hypothetical protein [bacterium]
MQRLLSTLGFIGLAVALSIPAAAQPCEVPDNGGGTVDLPPAGCGYVSPSDFHVLIDGLDPGTQINIDASHEKFFPIVTAPGGNLGGEIETFQSILIMDLEGQGDLAGFQRTLFMQLDTEVHTGPRTPGDPVQDFDNEMVQLQGEIFGDPDFDLLRITAGSANGLPASNGHTQLAEQPNGNFNVDSFFDIVYTIEFQGAPGSILEGFAGTTQATVRMSAGEPATNIPPPCVVQDNGSGTVDLPPDGCDYTSPTDLHMMIDGLPPGTTINIAPAHNRFFNTQAFPGGNLGGEIEQFDSFIDLNMTGTGQLAGFQRDITMQLAAEAHTGPRNPGDAVQTFPNDMFFVQGELFGDPDFDFLRIEGGTAFGLPSPGQTTLTQLPSGDFNVDSFFDITYRITFQGAPGSILDGFGGATQGSVGMQSGQPPSAGCPPLPAGIDVFPSTAKLVLQLDTMTEPIVVRLSSADLPDAVVDRGPMIGNTIDVELVEAELGGFHPQLGGVVARIGSSLGLSPTLGQLTDVQLDPATCELISADSFFDVVVEIDALGLGQTWTTNRPVHLRRKLTRLPPEDVKYENPFIDAANPLRLVDTAGGIEVGTLFYELHHADPPFPPGPDCFDTFMNLNAQIPTLGFFGPLQAQGPTTIDHTPGFMNGTCELTPAPCTSDADCPLGEICILTSNQMQQQISEMELQGFDPFLGGFTVRLNPDQPSQGQSVSQFPGHGTYAADSFFDVFFEVSLDDLGILLRNDQPLPVQAGPNGPSNGIRNVPPDPNTPFDSPPGLSVPLIDQGGTPVGQVSDVQHIIDTPRDWGPPPPGGEDCFDSWVTLEITVFNPFCQETVMLPGDFKVLRDNPTSGGTGQAIIDLLMVKGLFEANSQCVGPLTVRLDPQQASSGEVTQLAGAEFFPADSFFDIFLVADTGIGELNAGPSHMTTTVNSLPPEEGEIYFGPGTVIPLFDDIGNQVGEILEVSHEVHQQIVCPAACRPFIEWTTQSKSVFSVGIPLAGGGVSYDVLRGQYLGSFDPTNFGSMIPVTSSGPTANDPASPFPNRVFFYLARDRFGAATGSTWNSGGAGQVGNRDPFLP